MTTSAQTIHTESTAPYPSGKVLIGREIVRYTGKTSTSFTGCDRATNFRFDQKVILDTLQDDPNTGDTLYNFQVTDKVRRVIESATTESLLFMTGILLREHYI